MVKLNPRIRTLFSLGLTVFAIVILLACGSGAATETGSTPTSAPRTTVAASPTPKKTPTPRPPTPTPTPKPKVGLDDAVIGGTVAAFSAAYGQPINAQAENGIEIYTYAGQGQQQTITIFVYQATKYVYGVEVQAITAWSDAIATITCHIFDPTDFVDGDTEDLHDGQGDVVGIYQKSFSAKLGGAVDARLFVDNQGNPVKPGTFGINYYFLNGDSTLVTQCGLNLGYQPVNAK